MRTNLKIRLSTRLTLITLIIGMIMMSLGIAPQRINAQGTFDANNVQRATVQVIQMYANPVGQLITSCVGSGTLVSADGLILTNAHLVEPSEVCKAERIVIALTDNIGEQPAVRYYAEEVGKNAGWDLAILQITSTLDHRPVDRATLSLPFVTLGDSDTARLDDTVQVVGYAASQSKKQVGSINTVLRGTISGFTAEARVGDRAWLKTRLAIPGGMSGGGAYDIDGNLIGIPTIEPLASTPAVRTTSATGAAAGTNALAEDCRRIQDTNGDGRVDDQDSCVPLSGLINALRPSRLARGLILAAKLGLSVKTQFDDRTQQTSPANSASTTNTATGKPTFSRLLLSPGVDSAGMPTSVVTGMPTGTTSLYLFFDYDNMTDGTLYELRVTRDGFPEPTFSVTPATWSGGKRGLWYIGSTSQVWPNGTYEFTLLINGQRIGDQATKKITIGGAAQTIPSFSNPLFGVLDPDGQLVGTGNLLPAGNTVNGEIVFNNMNDKVTWRQVWYYEGLVISDSKQQPWKGGVNGKIPLNATGTKDHPLQPGRYRIELYIGDRLGSTADFVMAGSQTSLQTQVFKGLSFASQYANNKPSGTVGTTFGIGITSLYATFDWDNVATETPWTWRWTVDDNPLFEVTQPWHGNLSGTATWLRIDGRGPIPDGSYKVELLIGGVPRGVATAKVGLGQLPLSTFASAEGVQLQGKIIDAETKAGIPGVSIIVLKTEFAVADFTWNMSEVYDMALTDSSGQFTLTKLLSRGQNEKGVAYSVLIVARGYLPLTTDNLKIDNKTRSPQTLTIELNKD